MIAVDSSIAIAGFGEWHELNEPACEILDRGPSLPAHALLETYSVLTGFPPPYRVPAALVVEWLDDRLVTILPAPPVEEQRALIRSLAREGRIGGAVYDALVGLTAKIAGATLITADRRAHATYELVGVEVRLVTAPSG
jgi:predicted nucleic acid-binding protein